MSVTHRRKASSPTSRRTIALIGTLSALMAAACSRDSGTPTELSDAIDARPFLVGNALAAVDANGHFVSSPPGGDGLISPSRAAELARAAVVTFAPLRRSYLEQQHGGSLAFATLKPGRPYFADTPYVLDLPSDVHPSVRKYLGPYYLVPMMQSDRQVLSIAVSAYDSDIGIERGRIVFPVRHGNDFIMQGVRGPHESAPVSPEQAARIAASTLGARVSEPPQLLLAERTFVPQWARWRLTLEREVVVTGAKTGRTYSTREVFVGPRGELSVATLDQPGAFTMPDPVGRRTFTVGHRSADPLSFELVAKMG